MSSPVQKADAARGRGADPAAARPPEPDVSLKEREQILAQIEQTVARSRAALGPEGLRYKSERSGVMLPLLVNVAAILLIAAAAILFWRYSEREEQVLTAPRTTGLIAGEGRIVGTIKRESEERLAGQGPGDLGHPGPAVADRRTAQVPEGGERGKDPEAGGGAARRPGRGAGGGEGEARPPGGVLRVDRQAGEVAGREQEQGAGDRPGRLPSAGRHRACRERVGNQCPVQRVPGEPRGGEGREEPPGEGAGRPARRAPPEGRGRHCPAHRGPGKPARADPPGAARCRPDRGLLPRRRGPGAGGEVGRGRRRPGRALGIPGRAGRLRASRRAEAQAGGAVHRRLPEGPHHRPAGRGGGCRGRRAGCRAGRQGRGELQGRGPRGGPPVLRGCRAHRPRAQNRSRQAGRHRGRRLGGHEEGGDRCHRRRRCRLDGRELEDGAGQVRRCLRGAAGHLHGAAARRGARGRRGLEAGLRGPGRPGGPRGEAAGRQGQRPFEGGQARRGVFRVRGRAARLPPVHSQGPRPSRASKDPSTAS